MYLLQGTVVCILMARYCGVSTYYGVLWCEYLLQGTMVRVLTARYCGVMLGEAAWPPPPPPVAPSEDKPCNKLLFACCNFFISFSFCVSANFTTSGNRQPCKHNKTRKYIVRLRSRLSLYIHISLYKSLLKTAHFQGVCMVITQQ